jgi:glycosyltransferase involved in cell wall biosynthesis
MASIRPLRVLALITHLDVGGASDAAVNACAFIDRERFASLLACGRSPDEESDVTGRARDLGVELVTMPSLVRSIDPARDVRALRDVRRLIRRVRPDIVHTHSSKAGFVGRLAARREQVPVVVHTVHGWSFHDYMSRNRRTLFVGVERLAARWTDRIVTVSELDRAKGVAAGIASAERYSVIHELNDLEPFLRARGGDRAPARARLGVAPDALLIGTVGRLSDQKDPSTFVQTAAAIAAEVPEAHFVWVGHGPLLGQAEQLAAEAGLGERFLFTGARSDVAEILPSFDVFLLTSLWEGMPLVIPQAMACGVSVVVSTADGNRELVQDGDNGLLAPSRNPARFARRVIELLHDAGLRERLVRGGTATAKEFTLASTIPQLEQLYTDCANRRSAEVRQA